MGAVFGFLLGLVKQTLATSRRVRRELTHDQSFRHATPRCIYVWLRNLQMAPRKSHKKTRSGCVQCKRRKVKVNSPRRRRNRTFLPGNNALAVNSTLSANTG